MRPNAVSSHTFPSHILAVSVLAAALLSASTARADDVIGGTVLPAPIGHLQPRAENFSPQSDANKAEQQRLHMFNARQNQQDKELDQKLNVCRC